MRVAAAAVALSFVMAVALGYWIGRRLAPRVVWTVAEGFAPGVRR